MTTLACHPRVLVCLLVALGACASSTDGPSFYEPTPSADAAVPDPSPPVDDDLVPATGGYVRLERMVGGDGQVRTTALAELYTGHSGPGRVPSYYYGAFPLDHCFEVPLAPAEPSFYDFLDVGPTIELSGPAAISLPREALFDNIFYRAIGLENTVVSDAAYAVASDGLSGTLRMPGAPQVSEPAGWSSGLVTLGPDLVVHWIPVGADRLYLVFQQGDLGRVCRLADDGEFVVPAEASDMTPEWGTMALVAIDRELSELGGRPVELIGVQGTSVSYERSR